MTIQAWIAICGLVFTFLSGFAAVIIWLVRLEGQNQMTRALFEQHKAFVAERHGGIEDKIDAGFDDMKKSIAAIWTQVHNKADKAK